MEIREFQPGDEPTLNLLKQRVFATGVDRMRVEYWRWQYLDGPDGPGGGSVATVDGEVVGFIGFFPKRVKVRDHIVRAAVLADLMVDDRCRGQGVASGMARHVHEVVAKQGYAVTIGLANANSVRLLVGPAGGMEHVGRPVTLLKLMRPFPLPPGMVRSAPVRWALGLVAQMGVAAASVFPHPALPRPAVRITTLDTADDRLDKLWHEAAPALPPVAIVRDSAYVRWRYLDHPIYAYQLLLIEYEDRPVGWVVMGERTLGPLRLGEIVDWLIAPQPVQARKWVVGTTLQWAREAGVHAVAAAAADAGMPGVSALRRAGWFLIPARLMPKTTHFLVRALQRDLGPLARDRRQWFSTWGDVDVA